MGKGGRRHLGGKRWRKQRKQIPAFHILCEGKNTEPLYFEKFPVSNIAHCKGYSKAGLKLVETAIKYKRENKILKRSIDQVWVIFDYDYTGEKQHIQKEDFNNAIMKAEQNNIKWAVSNDSFELWLLLHFENCNRQELRSWYYKRLEKYLEESYDKDRSTANKMYELLLPHQAKAIERAEALEAQYNENDRSYADKNPFTTVHKLVLELNKFKKSK